MIYDISPIISKEIAVWPGDVNFKQSWQLRINEGANIDLSSFEATVHLGAHVDAPSHYLHGGKSIHELELKDYWGTCTVVDVSQGAGEINRNEFIDQLKGKHTRVLFKTLSYPDPTKFNKDFRYFSPDSVEAMASLGVKLIGIDTPSFDAFDSKELLSHKVLAKHDIRNLEGIVLDQVPVGEYELVALPLRLRGFDASPVRALLRTLPVPSGP